MKSLKDAISLDYLDYDVNQDISIHEGRFVFTYIIKNINATEKYFIR